MITEKSGILTFDIRVLPRSSVSRLEKAGDVLKLKITAPPVEGEANRAVIEFFADLMKLPKKNVAIIRGLTSKNKTVEIKDGKKELLV